MALGSSFAASTYAVAGLVRMSWRRFAIYSLVAATVWATYAGLLGYLGGRQFEDDLHYAFALAAGLAIGICALVELGRRVHLGRGSAISPIRSPRGDHRLPV